MGLIQSAVEASFAANAAAFGEAATYHRGEMSLDVTAIPVTAAWPAEDLDGGLTLISQAQPFLIKASELADLTSPIVPARGDYLVFASGRFAGRFDVLPEPGQQVFKLDPTRTFFEVLTKAAPAS